MKITKELLKKLVREAVEEEMGSSDQTDTKNSSDSDLVKKLKDKVLTIGSPSGWGEWITDKDDEWVYDDGEGGYDTELEFNYKDPANIVVSSGGDEKTIPLNNDDDIEKIIKYAERISGLKAESEEEDEGMLKESVKRRFAHLAKIKLNEGMEEAPKEEPLEASFPVDYGPKFSTNKRGIWVTVDEGGKLFVQFGGRIPAEKFFGKDLKPQDFQLKNDGDQHQISDNPMFRPSGDPLKSAQEERYRVLKKGKK